MRRDLNFESENRVNLISVISCSREVVDAYIVRTDIQSVGIYARNEHCSQTHINVVLGSTVPIRVLQQGMSDCGRNAAVEFELL
ncbi:MAG: hypothetical protein GWP69_16420 [Gammaproteobacteria bacterium]|nr:hypothetical protein [Gammaproteobacteria bacterium]NCF83325.1 hypothetical protein [Pseudomonadota bacterium]